MTPSSTASRLAVPIPRRMQHLARDARGYPIPVMVYRDPTGQPHFTINNYAVHFRLLIDDQCGICGDKLLPVRWFAGGPLSAFHDRGCYFDPPMHRQCLHFALKVCPYLALPSYTKRVQDRTIRNPEQNRIFVDPTVMPERPPVFVAVGAKGQTVRPGRGPLVVHLWPTRPYVAVEYWKDGKQISERDGAALAQQALAATEAANAPDGRDRSSRGNQPRR